MKNLLAIGFILVVASCGTLSPVGSWNYNITGTPQGDYTGVLIVSKKDKKTFNAVMQSNGSNLPFNSFTFDSKTKKSTGDFNYQGMTVNFDASVSSAEMKGGISVEGMNFPFKATRKKK